MSNIISTESKTSEVVKEARTYKLEIFTPKNKEYWGNLYHEVVELHDGIKKESVIDQDSNPITFRLADILARADTFTYKDIDGVDKTLDCRDVPMVVQAFCDVLRSEA